MRLILVKKEKRDEGVNTRGGETKAAVIAAKSDLRTKECGSEREGVILAFQERGGIKIFSLKGGGMLERER